MGLDLKSMQKAEPVKAPMPGLVLKVLVEPGQQINKGDGLVILEAMKMENIIRAERNGKIKKIYAKTGESLAVDQMILEFE